jgi:hypothetical protein
VVKVCWLLKYVDLEFYGWAWGCTFCAVSSAWIPIALVKEKKKKEKVTRMV